MNPFRPIIDFCWSLRGLVALGILAIVFVSAWGVLQVGPVAEYLHSRDLRDQERARVNHLNEEVRDLERERDRLEKDASFERERVARSRFHWSKPGEQVLLLQPPNRTETAAPAEATTATAPAGAGLALPPATSGRR